MAQYVLCSAGSRDLPYARDTPVFRELQMCLGRQSTNKGEVKLMTTVEDGCTGKSDCGLEPITLMRGWCRKVWLPPHRLQSPESLFQVFCSQGGQENGKSVMPCDTIIDKSQQRANLLASCKHSCVYFSAFPIRQRNRCFLVMKCHQPFLSARRAYQFAWTLPQNL